MEKYIAALSALIVGSLFVFFLGYLIKKRRNSTVLVVLPALFFLVLFATEMNSRYEAMHSLRTANKKLEHGLLNDARGTFENLTKTSLFKNEIVGSMFIFDAHLGLAETALKMGDYAKAKKELDILESKKWFYISDKRRLQLLMGMAEIYGQLGDRVSQERVIRRIEKMVYPETKRYEIELVKCVKFLFGIINPLYWKAQVDFQKAHVAFREKHYNKASSLLGDVESIGQLLGSYELLVKVKKALGDIYYAQKKYEASLESYQIALMLSERFLDKYNRAMCLLKVGTVETSSGKEAKENLSLVISISKDIGSHEILWRGLYQYGLVFEKEGGYQKAMSCYKTAIEMIESIRSKLELEKERAGFIGERILPYERVVSLLKKMDQRDRSQGYHKKALYYAERAKSRTLIEALTARDSLARSREDNDIIEREKTLLDKIASLREKLVKTGGKRLREKIENAEAAYQRFVEEVKLKSPELASLITVNPPDPEKIQKLIDSNTSIIEYFTTKDNIYAWLITRTTIKFYEIPVSKVEIENAVANLLLPNISSNPRRPAPIILETGKKKVEKEISNLERQLNRDNFVTLCQKVNKAIFAPIEKDIKTKNVVIVPHGVLHKLPFAALNDGSRYLIDKYALSVLPSLSALEFVVKKRNPDKGRLLALGNPIADYAPGFYELPNSESEISTISQHFLKNEIFLKNEATESVVKDKCHAFDVIHLASHGEFNEKQPLFSGLLLARDKRNDGYLQVHEVFGLELKEANLITLSACETALAKVEGGDDLVGLSRAFIYAGTPSILGTLWKVDDPATARIMEIFYDNWRHKGASKAKALRNAQIALKSIPAWSHPYFWAPFIMIGDWR